MFIKRFRSSRRLIISGVLNLSLKKQEDTEKMLGGGMRQAGYLAAACLYALEHNINDLKKDHENAKELKKELKKIKEIKIIQMIQICYL